MLSLLLFSIYLQGSAVILTPAQHGFFPCAFSAFLIDILSFRFID